MNVREYIKLLLDLPGDMEVVITSHSDWIEAEAPVIVTGVDKGGYIMRSHLTMSAENKAREKQFLLL